MLSKNTKINLVKYWWKKLNDIFFIGMKKSNKKISMWNFLKPKSTILKKYSRQFLEKFLHIKLKKFQNKKYSQN